MQTTEHLAVRQSPPAELPAYGSLYRILDELMELQALAEEPDLADDEREAIAKRIGEYLSAQVVGRKADGIAATVRECNARATVAAEEAKRLVKHAEEWMARADRIKASTLRAMQEHGIKVIETAENRLRIQGNGGVQPLDVFAAQEVPVELRRYAFSMTGAEYLWMFSAVTTSQEQMDRKVALLKLLEGAHWEPDGSAIRDIMRGPRVPCPECGGLLDVTKGCDACANTGTVPPVVPGARLLERGQHLRVE